MRIPYKVHIVAITVCTSCMNTYISLKSCSPKLTTTNLSLLISLGKQMFGEIHRNHIQQEIHKLQASWVCFVLTHFLEIHM